MNFGIEMDGTLKTANNLYYFLGAIILSQKWNWSGWNRGWNFTILTVLLLVKTYLGTDPSKARKSPFRVCKKMWFCHGIWFSVHHYCIWTNTNIYLFEAINKNIELNWKLTSSGYRIESQRFKVNYSQGHSYFVAKWTALFSPLTSITYIKYEGFKSHKTKSNWTLILHTPTFPPTLVTYEQF